MGNSTGWQHPEAWLAVVTSLAGNPVLDEEASFSKALEIATCYDSNCCVYPNPMNSHVISDVL